MVLSRWLRRAATAAPHLLLVEVPAGWPVRVAVEKAVIARGWLVTDAPADADILVVCGHDSGGEVAEALEAVWDQMPGPRARILIEAADPDHIASAFAAAIVSLRDDPAQRRDAARREQAPPSEVSDHAMGHDHGRMGDDGMDMSGPAGIPLASGGNDRDGLAMDVLRLPLGPVLRHWPPGLVVTVELQGDVVTDLVLDRTPQPGPEQAADAPADVLPARYAAAWRCDAVVSLLVLAGAGHLAGRAQAARDRLLDPTMPDASALAVLEGLRRALSRAWLLRWSLRDLARLDVPGLLEGDVVARLLRLVDVAVGEMGHRPSPEFTAGADEPGIELPDWAEVLPSLLTGAELATSRLAVASLAGFYQPASAAVQGVS